MGGFYYHAPVRPVDNGVAPVVPFVIPAALITATVSIGEEDVVGVGIGRKKEFSDIRIGDLTPLSAGEEEFREGQ